MKKKASLTIFALFLLFSGVFHPAHAAEAQADIDAPFDRLMGKAWALVLTGPEFDPLYIQQIEMLTPAALQIVKHEIVTIHFDDRSLNLLPDLSVFDYRLPVLRENKDTNLLEELLYTDDDVFSVVLVGKDGVTKYVWPAPVSPREIFDMMANPKPLVPLVPKAAVE
jgi:hypothetical protein